MDLDPSVSRLLWRCRRGTRELDEILEGFVRSQLPALSEQDMDDFQRLLETEDPLLSEWLCSGVIPNDQGLASIVGKILSSR